MSKFPYIPAILADNLIPYCDGRVLKGDWNMLTKIWKIIVLNGRRRNNFK